jgi:uncharacterized protein YndB with AHSA1/START domain
MPVKKDALDRHWVEMELVVPGTPEQVWRAIATGPGISAWFTPTSVEERVGGGLSFSFGELGSSAGVVTGWEPPRRFAYEEHGWSENAPPVATEVIISARSGGTCRVRMVHSLFASTDAWDDQLEGFESGWSGFFAVLRLYLASFPDAPAAPLRLSRGCAAGAAVAWSRLTDALGLAGANVGDGNHAANGTPPFGGVVERIQQNATSRDMLLRLEQPGPGALLLGSFRHGGEAQALLMFYFYGPAAPDLAEQQRNVWGPWLERLFANT